MFERMKLNPPYNQMLGDSDRTSSNDSNQFISIDEDFPESTQQSSFTNTGISRDSSLCGQQLAK